MKTTVNDVVAISRRSRDDGNKYWGRISGTKYEVMTADLIEAKFRSLGMADIHRKEFDLAPGWFPIDWSLAATGAGKTQTFKTLLPALHSVPIAGELDVDAVWVGLGTAADFAGRDVRGKAAVIHTMLAPGEMGQSAVIEGSIRRAVDAGAAAIDRHLGLLRQLRGVAKPRTHRVLQRREDSRPSGSASRTASCCATRSPPDRRA